jgi:hypothetical protein
MVKHSQLKLVVSDKKWQNIFYSRNTLLFGKTLRAFYTKYNTKRIIWQRLNSGMVIVKRIGQSACLLSKSDMIGYDRASETERVLVIDDGVINRR